MSKRACTLTAALAVLGVILAGQAVAHDAARGKKVTIASGKFADRSWSLAVKGRHHRPCYYLSLRGRATADTATCGPNQRRPPIWDRPRRHLRSERLSDCRVERHAETRSNREVAHWAPAHGSALRMD